MQSFRQSKEVYGRYAAGIQHIATMQCYLDEPCFRTTSRFCCAGSHEKERGWGWGRYVHEVPPT